MTVRTFRIVALIETVTWICMLGAVVLKRGFDVESATSTMGPIHGVAFLAFCACTFLLREELGWGLKRTLGVIGAAVVPLGGYLLVERRLLRGAAVTPATT